MGYFKYEIIFAILKGIVMYTFYMFSGLFYLIRDFKINRRVLYFLGIVLLIFIVRTIFNNSPNMLDVIIIITPFITSTIVGRTYYMKQEKIQEKYIEDMENRNFK